jgi:hypothetical protein
MTSPENCQCSCGETRFSIVGRPLLRAYCHCNICQNFNGAPFADITLFHAKDVIKPADKYIEFKSHKFPPVLKRGDCSRCGDAAIEYLNIPAMPEVVIIPSAIIHDKAFTPEPSLHIFYDKRVADIQDDLPKHSGYLKSELALGHKVIKALLTKNKRTVK